MTDLRAFIKSLPNAGDLDPAKRTANEREIERRVSSLPASERAKFETTLRDMASEQHRSLNFETKWAAAKQAQQLKEQLSSSK
ncbi:hypothetical protein IYY11_21325 [Methylocystis sp. H62]|uniref:hypothetical protein n=1 Tax=Methylocystis sp. H62 TaxID=2785789 RepID=UPI0018C22A41|nr:hypothetical protein [Methylocystis sp. H62]MBG0795903.1 hypothetical protein [Methylocystis sp. H62]